MNELDIDKEAFEILEKLGYELSINPFEDFVAGLKVANTDESFQEFGFVPMRGHCFLEPLPEDGLFLTLDKELKTFYDSDADAQSTLECALAHIWRNQQ